MLGFSSFRRRKGEGILTKKEQEKEILKRESVCSTSTAFFKRRSSSGIQGGSTTRSMRFVCFADWEMEKGQANEEEVWKRIWC